MLIVTWLIVAFLVWFNCLITYDIGMIRGFCLFWLCLFAWPIVMIARMSYDKEN